MDHSEDGRTLGGRPRFLGTVGSDGPAVDDAAVPFLFLLPFGRPRPRLTGSVVAAAPTTSSGCQQNRRIAHRPRRSKLCGERVEDNLLPSAAVPFPSTSSSSCNFGSSGPSWGDADMAGSGLAGLSVDGQREGIERVEASPSKKCRKWGKRA